MTARRPYMLRAYYDWLVDNDLTPHLVVDATASGVRVPLEFVQDGQIVLNIVPRAVGNLELGNDAITFNARFGGRPHSVIVPLYAVQAIYARENGVGTVFDPEEAYMGHFIQDEVAAEHQEQNGPSAIENDDNSEEPVRPSGRPSLKVVK